MNEAKVNEFALECLLLAGRIMIESGAEIYRVEDTLQRMAKSQAIMNVQSYVTSTGIILSLGPTQPTRITSIARRSTDLEKVALVNAVSRKLSTQIITLTEAYDELQKIQSTNYFLPTYIQVIAAAIASGSFLIMFNGQWSDFIAAMIAGGMGYLTYLIAHDLTRVRFFSEFTASLIVGILAFMAVRYGFGTELDKIIIGSVMPLVPGLPITIAVRDLMSGHLLSGLAKGAEAFLTAFAIGSGIAVVLSF